jgi:2-oxoglutarate dehydrogenase E1 component
MSRQDQANDRFSITSFLYGGNATYIEELQASYERNPQSVDPEWREFFDSLADAGDVARTPRAPPGRPSWRCRPMASWCRRSTNWASSKQSEEGQSKAVTRCFPTDVLERRAFVRAIMMIRAYRMRGHLHANLDPLGSPSSRTQRAVAGKWLRRRLRPSIFLDNVLGLGSHHPADARISTPPIARRLASVHAIPTPRKAWIQGRIEGRQGIASPRRQGAIPKLVEAEGFEQFIDVKYKGTKRFGLRRRGGARRWSRSSSAAASSA